MYSKLIIIGNLGRDPEMKYTTDGKAVTTFSVAASNRKDETVWFRISTRLYCVQQPFRSLWSASFEVVASSVKFLSGKDEPAVNDDVPF